MRMPCQRDLPFALGHQGVAMPGRNGHSAFCIEINCRRTLEHEVDPFDLLSRYFSSAKLLVKNYFLSHKKTLFDTDAHFS